MNLGNVQQQQSIEVRFDITNQHSYEIKILDFVTGCDCSQARSTKAALAPGESAIVFVTWETELRHGDASIPISVAYSADDGGTILYGRLVVRAHVESDFVCDADVLSFKFATRTPQSVRFKPARKQDFLVQHAYCTHAAFAARILDDGLNVEITFDPDRWSDAAYAAELVVHTNSAKEPTFRIPLKVEAAGGPSESTVSSSKAHLEESSSL